MDSKSQFTLGIICRVIDGSAFQDRHKSDSQKTTFNLMYLCYSDRYFNRSSQTSNSYLNRSTSSSVSYGIALIGLPLSLRIYFISLGLDVLTFRVLSLLTN